MIRTLLLVLVCALAAVAAAPAWADDAEGTVTGCLNAGDAEGWFVLTTDDGKEVSVAGGKDIAAHAENHKVELTGKWVENDKGGKHFEAASVAHKGVCE